MFYLHNRNPERVVKESLFGFSYLQIYPKLRTFVMLYNNTTCYIINRYFPNRYYFHAS